MKTPELLQHNLGALLKARKVTARDLAFWCGKSQAWVSKIIGGTRSARLEDLGTVAEFFGLTVSQLLTPGISIYTERRRPGAERRQRDRRGGQDRRQRHVEQYLEPEPGWTKRRRA